MHEPNSLSSQRLIHAPSEGRIGRGEDYGDAGRPAWMQEAALIGVNPANRDDRHADGGAYPSQLAESQRR
jgi:hypothetical protein